MKALQGFLVAAVATTVFSVSVRAQTGCTLPSMTNMGWSILPSRVAFDADASEVSRADLDSAREAWTNSPHCRFGR